MPTLLTTPKPLMGANAQNFGESWDITASQTRSYPSLKCSVVILVQESSVETIWQKGLLYERGQNRAVCSNPSSSLFA